MLSGRTSPGDKIGALDVGADDYVTKSFAMAELLARLRAAPRRDESAAQQAPAVAVIGRWTIDLTAHTVTSGIRTEAGGSPELRLTPTEWRILELLLRRKLEDIPSRPRHLLTEPGMGHRYQP